MKSFRLLDTGHLSAHENMALDEIILTGVDQDKSPPTLRFLQFKPSAALIGYNQDVSREIREDYCLEHGISINRRLTGGGAIFFQESALGWEVFGKIGERPFKGTYEQILQRICAAAARAISGLGINAAFRPRNDIEVDGRKISGTGGATMGRALMFQGTLLVDNDIERFVRALRVPVEKLKKRELESLLDRVCFLNDLIDPPMDSSGIKALLSKGFEDELGVCLTPGELTTGEKALLSERAQFFESDKWVRGRSGPDHEDEPLRSIYQTQAGTISSHLWLDAGHKRISQALITGDFFTSPNRLIYDLEAHLKGLKVDKEYLTHSVTQYLKDYDGHILGIEPEQAGRAVSTAADRLSLARLGFSVKEANELYFVNTCPRAFQGIQPRWLLLPYCSKDLQCPYRSSPGCDQCGDCEIGTCVGMAHDMGLSPITIQSFEHLMETLNSECRDRDGLYIGSCCEAFYSKHQREMEDINARGVLVNLDSTTCYDLGKGTLAYNGKFDNKTHLNLTLIKKVLKILNGNTG